MVLSQSVLKPPLCTPDDGYKLGFQGTSLLAFHSFVHALLLLSEKRKKMFCAPMFTLNSIIENTPLSISLF